MATGSDDSRSAVAAPSQESGICSATRRLSCARSTLFGHRAAVPGLNPPIGSPRSDEARWARLLQCRCRSAGCSFRSTRSRSLARRVAAAKPKTKIMRLDRNFLACLPPHTKQRSVLYRGCRRWYTIQGMQSTWKFYAYRGAHRLMSTCRWCRGCKHKTTEHAAAAAAGTSPGSSNSLRINKNVSLSMLQYSN